LILPTLSPPSTSFFIRRTLRNPLKRCALVCLPSDPKVCSSEPAWKICLLKEAEREFIIPLLFQNFFLLLLVNSSFILLYPASLAQRRKTQLHYGYHVEHHTRQVQEYVRAFYWTIRYIMVCFTTRTGRATTDEIHSALLGWLLVSYIPQFARIIGRKSAEGLSTLYILLGSLSGTCAVANIMVLPSSQTDISCCRHYTRFGCISRLLGIFQVVSGVALFWCM
jgi:hypothetical protein